MKKMEMSKMIKAIVSGVAVAVAGLFIAASPVKADVISEAQAGYEKGMAYLISTQVDPANSAVIKEAQSGYERGIAYLQSIQASTVAAAIETDRQAQAGYDAGMAYLQAIEQATAAAAAERDRQALDGLVKGQAYLQSIKESTAAAAAARKSRQNVRFFRFIVFNPVPVLPPASPVRYFRRTHCRSHLF